MLTNAQTRVWDFIKAYVEDHSYAPTISEITLGIGLKSRSAVHRAVHAIAEEGLIRIVPNKRRNIEIVSEEEESGLPVLGCIAAGKPIEAIDQHEVISLNELFVGPKRFLLKVRGNSMIGDNICDGDYVICEHCQVPRYGKIAVALIDDQEATLKRIYNNDDGTVSLVPSNPDLKPMVYPAERVKIQGIFIGLFRVIHS